VRGPRIGIAVHGHGTYAELVTGADDAQGNLAAVGDENFRKHGCQMSSRAKRGICFSFNRFILQMPRKSILALMNLDGCRSREQNQGDADFTDKTDPTNRSSLGSAPWAASWDELLDDVTPIASGGLVSPDASRDH
jgi:hypothetical protein